MAIITVALCPDPEHSRGYTALGFTDGDAQAVDPGTSGAGSSVTDLGEAGPGASSAEPWPRHVLVWYVETTQGRAALEHAQSLAVAAEARLTVLAVVTRERTDIGCARCRQSAAIWNHEMEEIAHEALVAAAGLLGSADATYETAIGSEAAAIAAAADRVHADLIVLPWRRRRRPASRRKSALDERLRGSGPWQVVISPPASTRGPAGPSDPPGR